MAPLIQVHIHRIVKPDLEFLVEQVRDDGLCLLTCSRSIQEDYIPWSLGLQALGVLPSGKWIASTSKWQFYQEYFSIITMRDAGGALLGYYCDICTPLRKEGEVYYTTDLLLDLWVSPAGSPTILDEDEFQEAAAGGRLEPGLEEKARVTLRRLLVEVETGKFPAAYIGMHNF
ncbi:MAG: DUF402 domain-containing protein [Chloroflexi bacterium]|nr:MAG: DUF402 domain-containing protein [Chloroflexota bacterium]